MNPKRSLPRRRRKTEFGPEQLESRELLTNGSDLFAIIPGTVTTTNGTAAITFTVDPSHFTLPRRAFTLGIDIAPTSGSTIKPFIASVDDPHGTIVPQTFHSIYDPHLSHLAVASGVGTNAVLTPVSLFPHGQTKPATYTVNVQALGKTSGDFLLGFFLPGDANGDGVVNKTDIQIVKSELNSRNGSAKFTTNADANRDGRIGQIDLAYTLQNQGVSTNVMPIVQANYDSSHDISPLNPRTTNIPTAHFTGTATPGATITYAEISNKVASTSTTSDSAGNYSINVPLAAGSNTFKVTSKDPFGQTITGTISPVTFIPPGQTVTPASLASSNATK
jgi:hypothetical protein